jgi:hypothetical protein
MYHKVAIRIFFQPAYRITGKKPDTKIRGFLLDPGCLSLQIRMEFYSKKMLMTSHIWGEIQSLSDHKIQIHK